MLSQSLKPLKIRIYFDSIDFFFRRTGYFGSSNIYVGYDYKDILQS
ncbi:hypothetical protein MARINOS108_12074 [Marinoscillum sp. 108]|nr:hypothetical protein MARINOS108_12074 [Marinoscillum sp. 108]